MSITKKENHQVFFYIYIRESRVFTEGILDFSIYHYYFQQAKINTFSKKNLGIHFFFKSGNLYMNKPLSKNLQNSLVYLSASEVNISGNVGGKKSF